jgi:putative mycofactocin binding protein MftB
VTITAESACELHPHVAVRPEPFGALAYHYDNRRLVFLRHPDIVKVVSSLAHHDSIADALQANDINNDRWPAFVSAIESLISSEIVRVR